MIEQAAKAVQQGLYELGKPPQQMPAEEQVADIPVTKLGKARPPKHCKKHSTFTPL